MKRTDYDRETRDLIARLRAAGFVPLTVDNGEAVTKWDEENQQAFADEAAACDESLIRCTDPNGRKVTLWLVYGNGPGELVCDYTATPELEAVVDAFYNAHNA
jgi:leucyl-tRNA synthetase